MNRRRPRLDDAIAVAVITAVMLAAKIAAGRFAAVPLDDSWNFVLPLKHFLESGVPRFDSFNSAAAVLHLAAAWPLAKLFGASFPLTAALNFLITAAAVYAVYLLARVAGGTARFAAIVALCAFAAPPVFVVAFTFQSDPVFLLVETLALAAFVDYARRRRTASLAAASVFAALSIWAKIHGLFLAPAFIAVLLAVAQLRKRTPAWAFAALAAPTLASYVAFRLAKPFVHPISTTLDQKSAEFAERLFSPSVWLADGPWRAIVAIASAAFYFLPAIVAIRRAREEAAGKRAAPALVVASLAGAVLGGIIAIVRARGGSWALAPSMLTKAPTLAPMSAWGWVYAGVAAGAPMLLYWLLKTRSDAPAAALPDGGRGEGLRIDPLVAIALIVILSQVALMVPIRWFMDRYFIVLVPPMALGAVAAARDRRIALAFAIPILLLILALDVVRVRQYRDGAELRWAMADAIAKSGVPVENIDGGYEWFGWHNFEACEARGRRGTRAPGASAWVAELCPDLAPNHHVTFEPPPTGCDIIETRSYGAGPLLGERPAFAYRCAPRETNAG
ncbi:hypothetical protein K8I61_18110 [bacterium]|nr:hypothetical protein [bacterium]